jgi:hypothetical protein
MSVQRATSIEISRILPGEVGLAWNAIERGVREVLGNSRRETTADLVRAEIAGGSMQLWLGQEGSRLAGFVVTQLVRRPLGPQLLVFMVWSRPQLGADFLGCALGPVERYAREHRCNDLVFYSGLEKTRGGRDFTERVGALGFTPTCREFVKELSYGRQ